MAGDGQGPTPEELGIERIAAGPAGDGGGWLARFQVGAESPLFAGHFPGRPLLPGVAQLALVSWALAAGRPPGRDAEAFCREIAGLRLRGLVHPGDTLEVRVARLDEAGRVRFDISRDGAPVTRGSGRWGLAASAEEAAARNATVEATDGEAMAEADAAGVAGAGLSPPLLPHAPPALLVRQALALGSGQVSCACEIGHDHPLARCGRAPGYLALEAAAQTAGLLAAAERAAGAAPRIGYLVGVKEARFTGTLPAGRPLRASAWLEASAPPLAISRFTISAAGRECASGIVSTYLGG